MSAADSAPAPREPTGVDSGPSRLDPEPRLDVYDVPRQSIVVLSGVAFEDAQMGAIVRDEIQSAVGHDEFAVLILNGSGRAHVWGPDADIAARVRALLPVMPPHVVVDPAPPSVGDPNALHPQSIEQAGPVTTSSDELRQRARPR